MDTKKIIAELATQYGIVLNKQDPILAAVMLNKLVLNAYMEDLEEHLAESITNVAIKEDFTLQKLRKLLSDKQTENRRETERILNQFADNLSGRLSAISDQNEASKSFSWLLVIGVFLGGLLLGGIVARLFL